MKLFLLLFFFTQAWAIIPMPQAFMYYKPLAPVNHPTVAMTSNSVAGYVASASSEFAGGGYPPWKAFNGTVTDNWLWITVVDTRVGWLQLQLPTSTRITKYTIIGGYSGYSYGDKPRNWTFEGYNGSSWVVLDTQVNQTFPTTTTQHSYTFVNPNSYLYYRLNITLNNGYARYVSVGELILSTY